MMTQEPQRAAYYKTPQRLHVYESSDKAKEIVQNQSPLTPCSQG